MQLYFYYDSMCAGYIKKYEKKYWKEMHWYPNNVIFYFESF